MPKTPEPTDPVAAEPTAPEPTAPEAKPVVSPGALAVNVLANLSLEGGQVLQVNQTGVTVPDTLEVRACIEQGYLALTN